MSWINFVLNSKVLQLGAWSAQQPKIGKKIDNIEKQISIFFMIIVREIQIYFLFSIKRYLVKIAPGKKSIPLV